MSEQTLPRLEYDSVIVPDKDDIYWNFDGSKPYFRIQRIFETWHSLIYVDPFPCSSHNPKKVKEETSRVMSIFPIPCPVRWIVLPNELSHYTNAWASYDRIYDEELKNKYIFEGMVALSGKRTIVHPAMTRYLAAHEYGHIVDFYITSVMEIRKSSTETYDPFRKMYCEMRGCRYSDGEYGGGRWKNNIGEVIADDFRIVLCDTDRDFWEHDRFRHPLEDPAVGEFWNRMKEQYTVKDDE